MVNGMQRYLELLVREGEEESAHQGQEPVDNYEFCRCNTSTQLGAESAIAHPIIACKADPAWIVMYVYKVTIELDLS